MKYLPILFSGPMVRAIIEDRKTQTRRVVKPQPDYVDCAGPWLDHSVRELKNGDELIDCPYGAPGDRLWVRETWHYTGGNNVEPSSGHVCYRADGEFTEYFKNKGAKWKPSIHMPRWASRITLEIVSVRVEQLQSISREDAEAEGIIYNQDQVWHWNERGMVGGRDAVDAYRLLWESINGPGSWEANPWVWVIEFKRVMPEVKE